MQVEFRNVALNGVISAVEDRLHRIKMEGFLFLFLVEGLAVLTSDVGV